MSLIKRIRGEAKKEEGTHQMIKTWKIFVLQIKQTK